MNPSQPTNYIKEDHRDVDKEIHDLDPRLVNALLAKIQQNAPAAFSSIPAGNGGRAVQHGMQGHVPYGSGSMHNSGGMSLHPHALQQPYNTGARALSPYGPQYGQQQQQQLYSQPPQGGYHHQHMDNGGYHSLNSTSSSSYYHQMHPGSSYGRQHQYTIPQQESFVPFGSKAYNEGSKVDPATHSSFLSLRGHDLINFTMNMVKIDPYISAEACKEILNQKFPELASNKYKVSFGALMSFYKVSQNCQEVPPDIVVMLSTIADAMNLVGPRGKWGISDEGDSINTVKDEHAPTAQPKKKRGRPRKHPEPSHSTDLNFGEFSKTGEMAISIMCNGKPGLFRLQSQTCDCFCDVCKILKEKLGLDEIDMSPKEFERHAGMGHMKKWRSSILVNNPKYKSTNGKSVGAFLAMKKIDTKGARGAHDSFVRSYAIPPGKGIPAGVNERLLDQLVGNTTELLLRGPRHAIPASSEEEEPTPTENPQDQNTFKIKRKVGRPRKSALDKETKESVLREAEKAKKEPVISSWKVLDTLNMAMEVSYGKARFSGILEFANISNADEAKVQNDEQAPKAVEFSKQPNIIAKADSSSPNRLPDETPSTSQPKSASKANTEKSPTTQDQGSQGLRHPLTCGLCGGPNEESIQNANKGYFGRTAKGLGRLKSIKVNSASTAWVHDQCARWSPEVHDPTGGGTLVGVKDAVIRGRRLKCKHCGKKGATIGCFSKRCKSSYHLPCAREVCVLKANPYFVCCPDHKADFSVEDTETRSRK